jgi:hypothetical protein
MLTAPLSCEPLPSFYVQRKPPNLNESMKIALIFLEPFLL